MRSSPRHCRPCREGGMAAPRSAPKRSCTRSPSAATRSRSWPRATALLNAAIAAAPASRPLIEAAVTAARQLVPQPPNVDFALGNVTTALGLPRGSALALFVVGRTVGWIAHAIEQYQSDVLIRPRARYTGPRPIEENPA